MHNHTSIQSINDHRRPNLKKDIIFLSHFSCIKLQNPNEKVYSSNFNLLDFSQDIILNLYSNFILKIIKIIFSFYNQIVIISKCLHKRFFKNKLFSFFTLDKILNLYIFNEQFKY